MIVTGGPGIIRSTRRGKFSLPLDIINTNPENIYPIFQQFIPITANVNWYTEEVEYSGVCPFFRRVAAGCTIPTYILVQTETDGIVNITWKELP